MEISLADEFERCLDAIATAECQQTVDAVGKVELLELLAEFGYEE